MSATRCCSRSCATNGRPECFTAGSSSTSRSASARPRRWRGQATAARSGRAQDQGRPWRDARSAGASGVLPIALGEATKLAGRMLDATKAYEFTDPLRRGDRHARCAKGRSSRPATSGRRLAAIEAVLPRFTGPIEQVPPAFSALKIDGKPAYARARAGEEVEMKARSDGARFIDARAAVEFALAQDRVRRTSPSPPPCPRAPTSAASPATSPMRLARSATSPC